jgi:hypothetical protein
MVHFNIEFIALGNSPNLHYTKYSETAIENELF